MDEVLRTQLMEKFSLVVLPPQNEENWVKEINELGEPVEVYCWGNPHGPLVHCGVNWFTDPVVVANSVDEHLVRKVNVEHHHGDVVHSDNLINVVHFTLEEMWNLLGLVDWYSCFFCIFPCYLLYNIYLKDLGGDDAEGKVKETDVSGWNNIFHEKPISNSLVILTEVPKIVHDAPQELCW